MCLFNLMTGRNAGVYLGHSAETITQRPLSADTHQYTVAALIYKHHLMDVVIEVNSSWIINSVIKHKHSIELQLQHQRGNIEVIIKSDRNRRQMTNSLVFQLYTSWSYELWVIPTWPSHWNIHDSWNPNHAFTFSHLVFIQSDLPKKVKNQGNSVKRQTETVEWRWHSLKSWVFRSFFFRGREGGACSGGNS